MVQETDQRTPCRSLNGIDSNFEGALFSVFSRTGPIREKIFSTGENLASVHSGMVALDLVYLTLCNASVVAPKSNRGLTGSSS